VYIVTDVDSNPPVKSPLKLVGSLLQPISHSVRSPGNFYHPASTPSQPYITADDHLVARSLARFSLASIYEHFKVLLAVLRAPSTSILFLLKLSIESVHAILMRLKIKGLQCRQQAQPGHKLSIADKNTVCESCDSYGHFEPDFPHRKPNEAAAQNRRDATWAEKNSMQTSKLQKIDKLIK